MKSIQFAAVVHGIRPLASGADRQRQHVRIQAKTNLTRYGPRLGQEYPQTSRIALIFWNQETDVFLNSDCFINILPVQR
jgi:hypothetical protein